MQEASDLQSGCIVVIQQVGGDHDALLGYLFWGCPDSIPRRSDIVGLHRLTLLVCTTKTLLVCTSQALLA